MSFIFLFNILSNKLSIILYTSLFVVINKLNNFISLKTRLIIIWKKS